MRILTNQLLHFDENRNVLENLDNIEPYPKFHNLAVCQKIYLIVKMLEIKLSQERISADKKTRIFKTHNVLVLRPVYKQQINSRCNSYC